MRVKGELVHYLLKLKILENTQKSIKKAHYTNVHVCCIRHIF